MTKKIEINLSSDTPVGISKTMGLAQISFSEALDELKPDLILILGDRYEIISAIMAALIIGIPIAHLNGGELTEGLIDEAIRHSLTKMSHLHFVATETYRNRVIQLGEQPKNVFNVGEAGLDNIFNLDLLSKDDFEASIGMTLDKRNILVTYHPVTLDYNNSEQHFNEILSSLDKLEGTKIIFTKANSDTGGRIINKMIDDYVKKNAHKSVCFTSLGQLRYLSALQYIDAIVGNSSSGLVEAPSFKIGTINIGDRQKGRIQAISVINCTPKTPNVDVALDKLYSVEFQNQLAKTINPYGTGGSSEKIISIIKDIDLKKLIPKAFYDIEVKL
ncbi:MAG: UDP-N-acetylglucosamine 2-epimerase (hydrolyzing) [Rhizobiales bacterium]|nr:UDP-N-acetylglucosamine 2-epimerase (hydrolyzing) [Hyphomicrobiales bacterium]